MKKKAKCESIIVGIDATNLRQGGGITHLIELLGSVQPENFGIAMVVIWGNASTLSKVKKQPWLIMKIPEEMSGGLIKRAFWQLFKLSSAVKEMGCDILFVPGGAYLGGFKPVVTMSRNLLPFEFKELFRYGLSTLTLKMLVLRFIQSKSFKEADGLIFLTSYAKEVILSTIGSIKGDSCIIPHGANERFSCEPRPQKNIDQYSTEHPYRILYVSIIDQYKHQWHVVEAVRMLRDLGWSLTLDLVGPAYLPALRRLKKVIKNIDPDESWVKYHGVINFEDLHQMYRQSDLGVFASSCENMPNILLEIMSSGLPIACSEMGPMPEILGSAGLYFDPENPYDIARSLRDLIDSPLLRSDLSKKSYQLSREFSWPNCSEKTFKFLSKIAMQGMK